MGAVYTYTPMGPDDSEFRRQTNPSLRAKAGPGTTTRQTATTTDPYASFERSLTQSGDAALAKQIEDMKNAFASLVGGVNVGGGGMSSSDALARDRFNYERAQDAAAAQKQRDVIAAYQNLLSGGGYRSGADRMIDLITQQAGVSEGNVNKAYQDALANIAAGFTTARDLTGQGYSALEQYLTQNPNNPFAGVQVSAGTAPDAMEQILSAYGVSADPVRAQVAAEQAAAEQGAAGFQNLLSTLGGVAQQSDASRLAEMMMAQNLAQTTLGQQRFGYESQASQAQAQAFAQIQAQLAQARLAQEAAAEERRTQIEDTLAGAGADPTAVKDNEDAGGTGGGTGETGGTGAKPQKPIDALKERAATANPDLKKKINQFVKANPNAGIKKIEKAFPKIASKIK